MKTYISANGFLRIGYGQTADNEMIMYASLPPAQDRQSMRISGGDITQAEQTGRTLLCAVALKLRKKNYATALDNSGNTALSRAERDPHIIQAVFKNPQTILDDVEGFIAAFDAAYHDVLREQKTLAAYMGDSQGPARRAPQP